jgi:hypothetical protein
MSESPFDPSESERVRLREVVTDIESHLSCLAREASAADHGIAMKALTSSWATLVQLMALGIAPAVRACPRCGYAAMSAAIRCGSCWSLLVPVTASQPSLPA